MDSEFEGLVQIAYSRDPDLKREVQAEEDFFQKEGLRGG